MPIKINSTLLNCLGFKTQTINNNDSYFQLPHLKRETSVKERASDFIGNVKAKENHYHKMCSFSTNMKFSLFYLKF